MHEDRPSFTAQWVAMGRSLGALLPDEAQLVDDPYGVRVAGGAVARLVALGRRRPALRPILRQLVRPLWDGAIGMQVRSRLIDDEVRRFVDAGGRQLVLLGAGFDARALRLAPLLAGSTVFEVDHPATQRLKQQRFAEGAARYVPWNFERDPLARLGARLAAEGLDATRATLTVWEGVTMYLTEPAIAATAEAVRGWSTAAGSRLCFTYVERAGAIERPRLRGRLVAAAVRRMGEPFVFGWQPEELATWWAERGWRLLADESLAAGARRMLPAAWARRARSLRGRHVATVEPTSRAP